VFIRVSLAIFILSIFLGLPACGGGGHQTAYVTTPLNGGVSVFHVSDSTGSFSQILGSPYPTGISPTAVLVHPSRKYVYIANAGEADISLYKVENSGALTEVTPRTPTGKNPASMVMDTTGSLLFVANTGSNTVTVYSIDSASGSLTPTAAPALTGFSPVRVAISPSGKLLYVANQGSSSISGFAIDSSGGLSPVPNSPIPVGQGPNWIAFDPSGKFLYVASLLEGNFSGFTVDSTSGALTRMNGSPYGVVTSSTTITPLTSLVVDSSGKYLYVTNQSGNNVYAFTIDGTTGVPTAITTSPAPPYSAGTSPSFIITDTTGKFLFVGNQSSSDITVFRITPATGVLTSIATAGTGSTPASMAIVK
jgi:6-phosphogluconolactonase (cycloisomerase 2 family)